MNKAPQVQGPKGAPTLGWADLLRLLEGTLAEGGMPCPAPEAPNRKLITTTPHTLNEDILTVLL